MFFSIIIPTYNPKKYLNKLLNSIIKNNCLNEIEIIIVDDQSEEDFSDILLQYPKCHFKVIKNDHHYGFSRVGRQTGSEHAQGKWMVFADQDDYFIGGIFDVIKSYIKKNKIQHYLATNIQVQRRNNTLETCINPWSLTHGKFYETSWWHENKITYPEVQYCEDANLQSLIECLLIKQDRYINVLDTVSYVWIEHNESQSLKNGPDFFFKSFPDYLRGELISWVEYYIQNENIDAELNQWYIDTIIGQIISVYFEFQPLLNSNYNFPPTPEEFYQLTINAINKFCNKLNMTIEELYNFIISNYGEMYNFIRQINVHSTPSYIEVYSLREWLKLMTEYIK